MSKAWRKAPECSGNQGEFSNSAPAENLAQVLKSIAENANVAGFTIAEYLPFDEYKLHQMFSGIKLFCE